MVIKLEQCRYLSTLVSAYTRRSLSFEDDAPRAIAGVLKTLSDRTGAQFWYDIPVAMFNLGTWWSVDGEEVPRATDTLPSWSWMAWGGKRICTIRYRRTDCMP